VCYYNIYIIVIKVTNITFFVFLGRKKKAAPLPPLINKPKLAPPQEESESEPEIQRKSQTLPITTKIFVADPQEKSKTVSRIELNNNVVEPNLSPATSSLSSLSRSDVDRGMLSKTPVLKYSKMPLSFLSSDPSHKYKSAVTLNNIDNNTVYSSQYKTESWNTFLKHLNDVLACKNEEYV